MSIIQTQTTSFKKELYQGLHDLLTDTIKIALYTANANVNETTTAYSTVAEVVGTGYTVGGEVLTGVTLNSAGYVAYVSFDNLLWSPAAFTTRCALVYNASKANRSVFVLDFGADKIAANTFSIAFPANTPTSAIIRSAN